MGENLTFSEALDRLKEGKHMARHGWNGKGLSVQVQRPDANSKMSHPYLYLRYPVTQVDPESKCVPWVASQTDLMAEDWHEVA